MTTQHLVEMANDIGNFFAAEPSHEDAVAGIANHIQRFWEPRMRRQILGHLQTGGEGLHQSVREALARVTVPPVEISG
jgi:formate dehydrogenase subunit delta